MTDADIEASFTKLRKTMDDASRLLIEIVRPMGLTVCAEKYGRKAIEIAPDFEGFEAWVETSKTAPVRARTRVLFPHDEFANASPQDLAAAMKQRCAEARDVIVANLKSTLAGLEAAP